MSPAGLLFGAPGMRLSDEGIAVLEEEEGFIDHAYMCPAKRLTIGFGHVIRPGERWPARITREEAREQLRLDVARAEDAVNELARVPLAQHQFDALVSFAFNAGSDAFAHSTMLALLNRGDYDGAAAQFARWVHGGPGGATLPVLVARRAREAARFRGETGTA